MYITDCYSLNSCKEVAATLRTGCFARIPDDKFELPDTYYHQARRLSRQARMGIFAVLKIAERSEQVQAIITSVGWGHIKESTMLLKSIYFSPHGLSNPTLFSQSTHNSLGGAISIILKNHGYNTNYIGPTSFESGLVDIIYKGSAGFSALLGGVDELSDATVMLLKQDTLSHCCFGEGANFFLVRSEFTNEAMAKIGVVEILNGNMSNCVINSFLSKNGLADGDIDLVLTARELSVDSMCLRTVNYNAICGKYPTSVAFALWLSVEMLNKPTGAFIPPALNGHSLKRILICNNSNDNVSSLILVERCR